MTTHNTHTPKFEPGNKFEAGRQCAFREMDAERWDVEMAIEYLAEIGEPISEFDAGYIAGVREFAGFTEGQ